MYSSPSQFEKVTVPSFVAKLLTHQRCSIDRYWSCLAFDLCIGFERKRVVETEFVYVHDLHVRMFRQNIEEKNNTT